MARLIAQGSSPIITCKLTQNITIRITNKGICNTMYIDIRIKTICIIYPYSMSMSLYSYRVCRRWAKASLYRAQVSLSDGVLTEFINIYNPSNAWLVCP